MIRRLIEWWTHDPRMARHATLAAIRQEMNGAMFDLIEKGEPVRDYDDTTRVRDIIEALHDCNQRPTLGAIASQFRFETGRDLPEVWKRTPPSWLRRRIAEDAGASPAPVGRED